MADPVIPTRGDETRLQLLEAGLRLFASNGYEAVSTRQLATEAGANVAAIAYHFGGKRDLYRAVLHQLVKDTEEFFGPVAQGIDAGIKQADGDPQELSKVVARFVNGFTRIFIQENFMTWRAPLVMREFAMPSEDFSILYDGRLGPLHKLVTRLAASALNIDEHSEEAIIRAHTIMGHVVTFEIAREILFRRTGWDGYTPDRVALVAETATKSVIAALGLPPLASPSNVGSPHD